MPDGWLSWAALSRNCGESRDGRAAVILVDSSVWIDHFRAGQPRLVRLLDSAQVLTHPFVIGELACGNLKNRKTVLSLLSDLPAAPLALDDEVLFFIEKHRLMGKGIGYIDAHLLSAVSMAHAAQLWTKDKRLSIVAGQLKLNFTSSEQL